MSSEQVEQGLKPCPFCGKESSGQEFGPGPYLSRSRNSQFKSIICSGCCSIAFGETESRAIERWNTRASLPEDGKLEAAARRAAEKINEKSLASGHPVDCDICRRKRREIAAIITAELRGEKEG